MRRGTWMLLGWMACSGDGGPDPVDSGPDDTSMAPDAVGITIPEAALRVVRGGTAELGVTVDGQGGFDVVIEGLPPGVEATPTILEVGDRALTFTGASTAEPGGAFDVRVTVSQGDLEASASFDLYVAGMPGEPDLSYSFDGVATYVVTDRQFDAVRAAALDNQGRLLVAGVGQGIDPWLGWVVRLLPDGTIDPDFGAAGEITTFGDESDMDSVLVLPDDAMLVLGRDPTQGSNSLLFAFTADGTPDTSIGTNGVRSLSAFYRDLHVRPGGYLVSTFDALVALNADGAIDGGFTADLAGLASIAALGVDDQGRIVAGGFGDGTTFRLLRLLSDGATDPAFGVGGTLDVPVPDFGGDDALIEGIQLDADGGGIALTETSLGTLLEQAPRLLRFRSNGTIDPGFGGGGLASVLEAPEVGPSRGLLRVSGDRIVTAAGTANGISLDERFLARFNPDGSPDPTFGDQGRVLLQQFPRDLLYEPAAGRVYVVAEQGGGGILVQRFWL